MKLEDQDVDVSEGRYSARHTAFVWWRVSRLSRHACFIVLGNVASPPDVPPGLIRLGDVVVAVLQPRPLSPNSSFPEVFVGGLPALFAAKSQQLDSGSGGCYWPQQCFEEVTLLRAGFFFSF